MFIHEIVPLMAHNASRLLLPLNVCRKKNLYLPWECEHERHEYERYVSRLNFPLQLSQLPLHMHKPQMSVR